MRIYISGGPNRQRFSNGMTQQEIAEYIMEKFPDVEVVKGGQTDYIVIDNENCGGPSSTAKKTGGQVIALSQFMGIMRRRENRKASKKKVSKKKYSGATPNLEEDEKKVVSGMKNLTIDETSVSAVQVFAKYAVYVQMLVSGAMVPEQFLTMMQHMQPQFLQVFGSNSDKLAGAWQKYFTKIADLSSMFSGKTTWSCAHAVDAQGALGHLSDRIVALIVRSQKDDDQVEHLMDFFTNHNNDLVQLMMADDNNSAQSFDLLLTSTLKFATMWK